MARSVPSWKKVESIRLRVEEQFSTPTIARMVRLSNSSVYAILEKYPWMPRQPKRASNGLNWLASEDDAIRKLWPGSSDVIIKAALSLVAHGPRYHVELVSLKLNGIILPRGTTSVLFIR